MQAGMVAAAAGMVVRTAGANMRILRSKSIQINFGSGFSASCFLQFQDYVSQFLAWLIELRVACNLRHGSSGSRHGSGGSSHGSSGSSHGSDGSRGEHVYT